MQDTTEMPVITDETADEDIALMPDAYEGAYELDHPSTDEGAVDAPMADEEPAANQEAAAAPAGSPILTRAGQAALDAQHSIREGITAFRDVRDASRRHARAREELSSLQSQLDTHVEELEYRLDIEQRYPQILAEQTAEVREATQLAEQAAQHASELEAERADLEAQLAAMKSAHEEQLRPYRNLAESTKGRADDTARSLAEARRAAKAAEGAVSEAAKRRDQRITSAHRAVDNAQERLRRVQAQLQDLQVAEQGDQETIERLQREQATEAAHLEAARNEVTAVTEEMRQAVENTQQRLFDLRQVQSQAERDAETARREAQDRRTEYDNMLKQAQEQERALSEQLKQRVAGIELARREEADARNRVAHAQELIDEAEAIHATPQQTIALRDLVAREQTDCDVQQDAVDELAANERDVRKGTLRLRLMLIFGAVGIVLLLVAIVLLVVSRH